MFSKPTVSVKRLYAPRIGTRICVLRRHSNFGVSFSLVGKVEPCPFHDLRKNKVDAVEGVQCNPVVLLVSCPHCTRNSSSSCRHGQENNALQVTVCLVVTLYVDKCCHVFVANLCPFTVAIKQFDGTTRTLTCDKVVNLSQPWTAPSIMLVSIVQTFNASAAVLQRCAHHLEVLCCT